MSVVVAVMLVVPAATLVAKPLPAESPLLMVATLGFDDVQVFLAGNSEDSFNPLVLKGGDQKIRAFNCLSLARVHWNAPTADLAPKWK